MTISSPWPRAWGDFDSLGRFLIAAVALIDRLDEERADIEVGKYRLGHRNAGTAALGELCRALGIAMTPSTADVLWARAQRHANGWGGTGLPMASCSGSKTLGTKR
ncbi:hypothetical protein MYK68_00175 [Gordonia sp. PP30]|uniref:hypothetical protein n=1 Tax=Gordonia sp. PP30 TaxID=2935861 RepID=UPI001FFFEB47|nr:hypothetical protein [Gordonia sp. PP30]UQE75105.1 hypothetical protein MYK68_00175 [Gordonia sp. PP30]